MFRGREVKSTAEQCNAFIAGTEKRRRGVLRMLLGSSCRYLRGGAVTSDTTYIWFSSALSRRIGPPSL